ncbi:hypothetical protein XCV3848 [Xanthomonas euvesicatoria pv. vesicatoria str. 85-10]|uniref:Uncharacterized protein n=1 Tax=Xanthomonas euvesicatoria pv. vesicatoria (strain 85-10) TaxID=316273 RepID=Q3BNT4_XANE5|nr:hypothetical protein XCV3848 [Xanthomonas euvesicatoria pv. vesicatoria str. 85-10]
MVTHNARQLSDVRKSRCCKRLTRLQLRNMHYESPIGRRFCTIAQYLPLAACVQRTATPLDADARAAAFAVNRTRALHGRLGCSTALFHSRFRWSRTSSSSRGRVPGTQTCGLQRGRAVHVHTLLTSAAMSPQARGLAIQLTRSPD